MKMKSNRCIAILLFLLLAVSCTKNAREDEGKYKRPDGWSSCEVIKGDTVNRTDINGLKQGRWIAFQMSGKMIPVEEGLYVNNEKDGMWKYYDSSGKLIRLVKFKNDRAW
jgi:antitoxin component YwqK of YwqJK toxin-antitoxin module